MRPGQNRRMRGRNNNRKGPNPLTRSYESNGPDVKIRGTAQHIAEKYAQLARDAQSSGDPVAAENYHQHAEHYYRIIAAAQAQLQQAYGGSGAQRPFDDNGEGDDGDDGEDNTSFGYGQHPQPAVHDIGAPQPDVRGGEGGYVPRPPQPYRDRNDQPRHDRQSHDRQGQDYPRQDRQGHEQPRQSQPRADMPRQDQPRSDQPRQERGERFENGNRQGGRDRFRRDNPRFAQNQPQPAVVDNGDAGNLPAFLTTPVRQPISVDAIADEPIAAVVVATPAGPEGGDEAALLPRRRRGRPRRSSVDHADGASAEGGEAPAADLPSTLAE